MLGEDSQIAPEIIAQYPRLLIENYCIVASSALLWFDFALTLPDEYRRIWKRKFSGATVIYLLMRYVAVIERVFLVLEILVWNSSDRTCVIPYYTYRPRSSAVQMRWYFAGPLGSVQFISMIILMTPRLAAFTALRLYGVWDRDWKPLLVVLPLSLVRPILYLYESANYIPIQLGPPYGCAEGSSVLPSILSNFSITVKATTIAADGILIVLTWIKTFSINRDSFRMGFDTPLATLLLRDGTAYFLVSLIIQIITIVSNSIGSDVTVWLVWPYFEQVVTVICFSRFMLDLRGIYFTGRDGREADTTLHLSDVRFEGITSTIIGNLGSTTSAARVEIPDPELPEDSDASPGPESADSLERRHAWEWRDEEVELSDDPFKAGFQSPEKRPVFFATVAEASEKVNAAKVDGTDLQETQIGDTSPV